MSVDKVNIFLTAHATTYRERYTELAARIHERFPGAHFRVLYGCVPPADRAQEEHERFLLPPDFTESLNGTIGESALYRRLASYAGHVPLDLHRSDLRFVAGQRTEGMLALELTVLCEAVEAAFADEIPDLVFVSSGTNILHSVVYYLATARGAKTYRVHNYLNLNRDLAGQRVWFCSNNRMALSAHPEDSFSYDADAVRARITELHEAIANREFRLDTISKKFRARRMPTTVPGFARDLARILYFASPFHGRGRLGRLSANLNRDRLRALVNSRRNLRTALQLERLPAQFVLFALNTPYDSQILVRAPEYRDILSLIALVAGMMPIGYNLVVREHPAYPGSLDHSRFARLRRLYPHVKLASPDIPLLDVVAKARGVLIINNTVFVDAILAGKPVLSLANGYFRGAGLTREIGRLADLRPALDELVAGGLDGDNRARLAEIMASLFQETFPGPESHYEDKTETISDGIMAKVRRIESVYGSLGQFRERVRARRAAG